MQTVEVPDHLYPAIRDVVDTLTRKGQDYSDSDDEWSSNFEATSRHFGIPTWECADFNEVQKLARLSALKRRGRGPLNERVEDTYRDKACYAVLAYALLQHHQVIAHPIETGGSAGGDSQSIVTGSPAIITAGGAIRRDDLTHGGPRGG